MAARQGPGQGRWAGMVAWLLVAAIAVSLAYWTWRVLPLAESGGSDVAGPAPAADVAALKDQGWFGAQGGVGPVTSHRYVLRWVYPGRPGVAILALPGLQDRTFRVGDEVEPGLVLREVQADHVIVEGAGVRERIELPPRPEGPPPGITPVAQ